MELEVVAKLGAAPYERTADRTGYRNGHRVRTWDTRVGTIEIEIPKLRRGSYFPGWLFVSVPDRNGNAPPANRDRGC